MCDFGENQITINEKQEIANSADTFSCNFRYLLFGILKMKTVDISYQIFERTTLKKIYTKKLNKYLPITRWY